MYLGVSQNVSYMLCYKPREYMYLDILHVFHTYPKRVQDTFWDTHQIHQDTCILGASLVSHWIHVRIHQDTCISWTLHQDTSGYTEIQNHDTCILDGIHAGYNLKRISRIYPVRYVTEMQDTCEIQFLRPSQLSVTAALGADRHRRQAK